MGGEVFRGRKALLRELSLIFQNFDKEEKDLDKGKKVGIIERVEKLKVRWSRG